MKVAHGRWVWVTVCAAAVVGGAHASAAPDAEPRLPELVAPRVPHSPSIDGAADEAVWLGAGRIEVTTTNGPTVRLRAVVAGDRLYLLAQWADPTASLRKGAWSFDGTRWQAGSKKDDEDRLAFLWPIEDSIPQFRTHGCAVMCHTEDPDKAVHDMWTNAPPERADLWHWKSARSNPAGWADDQHLVYLDTPAAGGGRRGDPDTSPGYVRNRTPDGTEPAFAVAPRFALEPRAKDWEAGAALTPTAAIPLHEGPPPQPGALLPAYLSTHPTGNRGDIDAAGRWAEGTWTIELSRALVTGYGEDVQFGEPGVYPFGLAVMDNGGGKVHRTSGPLALRVPAPRTPGRTVAPVVGLLGLMAVVAALAAARDGRT